MLAHLRALLVFAAALTLAACSGSPGSSDSGPGNDGGGGAVDAGKDAGTDAGTDAGPPLPDPCLQPACGWRWVNPLPQGGDLNALWGSGPNDVWAVGTSGAVLHWDGSAWKVVPSNATQVLESVWGSGPSDVWAAGLGGALLHWDGQRWTPSAAAADAGHRYQSVWGTGPSDVWLVGDDIEHLGDAGVWTARTNLTAQLLYSVWGTGPDDVWTVGAGGTTLHWDGGAWTQINGVPAQMAFYNLWGTGPDNVWGVGEGSLGPTAYNWNGANWFSGNMDSAVALWGTASDLWAVSVPNNQNSLAHFDGGTWTTVLPASSYSTWFTSLWGSASDDVWAAGNGGTLAHWDGGAWSIVAPAGSTATGTVWAQSPTNAWIAAGTSLGHWDGSQWTFSPTPNFLDGGSEYLTRLWGSGSQDVWATGYTFVPGGSVGLIAHFDGSAWSLSQAVDGGIFNGVSGSGPDDVWAMGGLGGQQVEHWNGSAWSPPTTLTSGGNQLSAIWASGPNDAWVGAGNLLEHWDGTAWTPVALPSSVGTKLTVLGISGSGPSDVWFVGQNNGPGNPAQQLLHWDGSGLTGMALSVPGLPFVVWHGVWASGPGDVWVVGQQQSPYAVGALAHWNGSSWTVAQGDFGDGLSSVSGSGPTDVWATGSNGAILHNP